MTETSASRVSRGRYRAAPAALRTLAPTDALPPARDGILLVNLGTPDTPDSAGVRRFLREFLSDPRVVELPRPVWLPILYLAVLTRRPARVAPKYAEVWLPEGSPLLVWSERQRAALSAALRDRGHMVPVALGMRYGNPSLASAIDALQAQGCTRLLVWPLYPQYSASTTATVVDKIGAHLARLRVQPELHYLLRFPDDPGYIAALAGRVRAHWAEKGRGDILVMSFHGLPEAMAQQGDPYFEECQLTAHRLGQALGLAPHEYRYTFQSRFGAQRWLQPYTEPTLCELARTGTRVVDVICPGFVADCLETLEEIAQECREAFVTAGGSALRYIAALNDDPAWIEAMVTQVERHLPPAPKP